MIKNKLYLVLQIIVTVLIVFLACFWAGNTEMGKMIGRVSIFILFLILILITDTASSVNLVLFKNPAGRFFLALIIIALFQGMEWTGLSIYPYYSFSAFTILLSCFFAYFVSGVLFQDRKSIMIFLVVLMLFGFLESAIGLSQAFSGRNTLFGIMSLPRGWRAYGTFYNPDHFSAFLELCFFSSAGIAVSVLPSRERFLRWRDRIHSLSAKERNILFLILFFAGVILLGIIYTKSRMGIFSTFTGIVFFIIVFTQGSKKSAGVRRLAYLIGIIVVVSFYLGLESIVDRYRLSGIDLDPEYGSRGSLWRTSLYAMLKKPILGYGVGTFRFAYLPFQPLHLQGYYTHAHNDYVESVLETGILGIMVIIGGAVYYFKNILRTWSQRHNPIAKGLSLGLLAGIVSVAVHSAGDFVLRSYVNGILFSIIIALTYNAVVFERYEK